MRNTDRPQTAYRTTDPAVLATWMSTAEKIGDIGNRAVDEAEAIGKNKGLMVQRTFGDERFVGLVPLDPKDPPAGWRYVREQFEPRRGKPGEDASAWLASVQVPSMRTAMKEHGLPRHCSFKFGFFGVPGMFQHDGVIWVIYSGEPESEPGPAWEKVRPSEYLAAQERMQEAERKHAGLGLPCEQCDGPCTIDGPAEEIEQIQQEASEALDRAFTPVIAAGLEQLAEQQARANRPDPQ